VKNNSVDLDAAPIRIFVARAEYTKAERDILILWSVSSSSAWLEQAIIVAPSMA
jgi:hypothetical protein